MEFNIGYCNLNYLHLLYLTCTSIYHTSGLLAAINNAQMLHCWVNARCSTVVLTKVCRDNFTGSSSFAPSIFYREFFLLQINLILEFFITMMSSIDHWFWLHWLLWRGILVEPQRLSHPFQSATLVLIVLIIIKLHFNAIARFVVWIDNFRDFFAHNFWRNEAFKNWHWVLDLGSILEVRFVNWNYGLLTSFKLHQMLQ